MRTTRRSWGPAGPPRHGPGGEKSDASARSTVLDETVGWEESVAALVSDHEEVAGLISEIAEITADRVATDDVTALAVFRRPSDGPR